MILRSRRGILLRIIYRNLTMSSGCEQLSTPQQQLAVCCLNISEGRHSAVVEAVAHAAVAQQHAWTPDTNISTGNDNVSHNTTDPAYLRCKATVLNVYMDRFYNRGNITIAAPVHYLSTAVYQACLTAFQYIDLKQHLDAGHPRLGAVDLVPIHPVSSQVSLATCGIIARNIGEKIVADAEGASVFFFGHADASQRGLIQRRKEINWFDMDSAHPDLGEFNESFGVTGVGAIPYMSVLNILLDTYDLSIGRKIALKLRASTPVTGLPGIQTMAFRKDEGVEIACNVDTNELSSCSSVDGVFRTSFEKLEEAIRSCAEELGVGVVGEVIRGYTPHEAYGLALRALRLGDVSPWKSSDILMM